ncbi:MAG: tRNA (N6-isopentenyl adenosine(37)-C2)-methylthiotransferase MiaB [Candidatus Omnitrophica bacterium]|nr:tRNA (N6-isopentenyl adenosine(37)-C2)-methylthiotransferase MiaB [Candidatus Omnitrophota bacterium]
MSKKVFLRTFGCQMNERDSEMIAGMLKEKGYEITDDPDEAQVILFNTCSVRQHAEDRVMGNVRQLRSRKKKDPELRIGVLGCMAQRHGEMLFKELPEVDLLAGPSNIYDVPDLLARSVSSEKVIAVDKKKRPGKKAAGDHRSGVFSAFVNIMYGCDNFCSYCIVPHVRGREVSRKKKDIVDEVKSLIDRGFKEVTLLGQNVNSYGKGLSSRTTFPDLLEAVNGIRGIERIRFTTSHPKDAAKPLFRAMAELDKVCTHLHLPLQSGSDKILDLMNRKYTYSDYLGKVELLRKMVPGIGLSTDIIVGFPSEKVRDFEATRRAMEEISYNSAFVFKYSPRPPAMSSCIVDDVPEEVKKQRNNELLALQKKISLANNRGLIGTEQEVLVEGKSRMSGAEMMGRTSANIPCVFPATEALLGELVWVRIDSTTPNTLKGKVVQAKGRRLAP